MIRSNAVTLRVGLFALAIGYFVWYTPYAALTKALSSGLLPGVDDQVGGLVLLPATAIGALVGTCVYFTVTGRWRHLAWGPEGPRPSALPSRRVIACGLFMALIIATTTLNYTFVGVSILFMLLMMRAGVLVLSPIVDAVRRRRVRIYSWIALTCSLLAVATALGDVDSYSLTIGAVLSLAVYFVGYIGRFEIMSRIAKTNDLAANNRYLSKEMISAMVWQLALCAIFALIGAGPWMLALREGFTSFLVSPGMPVAFLIGVLYSGLYVYGTKIYLDPREYTWCVPANRCSSLFAGLAASYVLMALTGIAPPGPAQLLATGFVFLAIVALSLPTLESFAAVGRLSGLATSLEKAATSGRVLLFVCGGNTSRSAMAEAIARRELSRHPGSARCRVISAGLSADPGAPITPTSRAALRELGVTAGRHRSRPLTGPMIQHAEPIFCMTAQQRDAIVSLAPGVEAKTFCLDPDGDIPDPSGQPADAYRGCAQRIDRAVGTRLREFGLIPALASADSERV